MLRTVSAPSTSVVWNGLREALQLRHGKMGFADTVVTGTWTVSKGFGDASAATCLHENSSKEEAERVEHSVFLGAALRAGEQRRPSLAALLATLLPRGLGAADSCCAQAASGIGCAACQNVSGNNCARERRVVTGARVSTSKRALPCAPGSASRWRRARADVVQQPVQSPHRCAWPGGGRAHPVGPRRWSLSGAGPFPTLGCAQFVGRSAVTPAFRNIHVAPCVKCKSCWVFRPGFTRDGDLG